MEKCSYPNCRQLADGLIWLNRPLCRKHWSIVCEATDGGHKGYDEMFALLKIPGKDRVDCGVKK